MHAGTGKLCPTAIEEMENPAALLGPPYWLEMTYGEPSKPIEISLAPPANACQTP